MTAFKCDICGAYYGLYRYYANQEEDKPNMLALCRVSPGTLANHITQTYDACPNCMKAIQSLIKERKSHNIKEE